MAKRKYVGGKGAEGAAAKEIKKVEILITGKQLAGLLGIEPIELKALVRDGILKATGDRFNVDNVAAFAKGLRKKASGQKSSVLDENGNAMDPGREASLLRLAQAETADMQRAVAEGRLIPKSELDRLAGTAITNARNRIEYTATSWGQFAMLNKAQKAIVKEECKRCLDWMVATGKRAAELASAGSPPAPAAKTKGARRGKVKTS